MGRILVVDDEAPIVEGLTMLFEAESLESAGAGDLSAATKLLAETFFPVIVADLCLRSTAEGLRLLDEIRRLSPQSKVVTISGFATPELEEEVRRRGSMMVLHKPIAGSDIVAIIRELLEEIEREAALQEPVDLDALYESTRRLLHSIPQKKYRFSAAESEDLVQQAWLLFLQKRGLIRSPKQWLAGTVVNLCRQEIDRVSRAGAEDGDILEQMDDPRASFSDDTLALRQSLERLDQRTRDLCEWIGLDGYSYDEVSNAIAISLGSVGPMYMRAKEKLRRALFSAQQSEQKTISWS